MKKIVLITGCSSGIGRVTVIHLIKKGFHVIATARRQQDVDELKNQGIDAIRMDMADHDQLIDAISVVREKVGNNLYAIFSNAGYGQPGAIEDIPTSALRVQMESNFIGVHTLVSSFLPEMRKRGQGRIVINSSVLGFAAMPYRAAYNASKFALEGWASTLRLETYRSGIFVSVIQPGPINTSFRANAFAALVNNIDIVNSFHADNYKKMMARLQKKGEAVPFTLSSDDVAEKVVHAIVSVKPKKYYRVTIHTKALSIMSRVFPPFIMDKLLRNGI